MTYNKTILAMLQNIIYYRTSNIFDISKYGGILWLLKKTTI